jgi:phosphoadenosine phosphosulfate reductase
MEQLYIMKIVLPDIFEKINGHVALAFSHQREDVAVLDMLLKCRGAEKVEIFTLDTLELFPETYAFNREVEEFFGISVKIYCPDPVLTEELENEQGEYGIRESIEKRKRCCYVRKVKSLKCALEGKSAWITGLRAEQSVTRSGLALLEYDEAHGLIKINPLVHWSEKDVSDYTEKYGLPVHPLYKAGYKSIGCFPCTRPTAEGEAPRAGRWWWEDADKKECGLHIKED